MAEAVEGPNGNPTALAKSLRQDGLCVEDVLNGLRCHALTNGQLMRILKEVGFTSEESWVGVKHFSSGCAHEGGGEIGAFPSLPCLARSSGQGDRSRHP